MIFLTLATVNNFAKNEFEEEIFYAIFFLFNLYYHLLLLDGNNRDIAQQILCLTVLVHTLSI